MTKEEIVLDYINVCNLVNYGDCVSRSVYRKYGTFKTSLIEKIYGTWTNFVNEVNHNFVTGRGDKEIFHVTSNNKVVITSVYDGYDINEDCLNTLINYCNVNDAELYILWVKSNNNKTLSLDVYNKLQAHLVTELNCFKQSNILIKDLNIPLSCKNPLSNLERLQNKYETIIVPSPKQYMKVLPYDSVNELVAKTAWSTGTISNITYKNTVSGTIDKLNHTFGALLLEYNTGYVPRYVVRNLIYKDDYIYDLNNRYSVNSFDSKLSVSSIVLGDLHFPEHSMLALKKSIELINKCDAESVILHDWCSFNSINHHEEYKYLTKVQYNAPTLQDELEESGNLLKNELINKCPNSTFYLVHSNHDDFIKKWLDNGDFIKDKYNAVLGCKMFINYVENKCPFFDYVNHDRLIILNDGDNFSLNGVTLSNHGHGGISGSRGNVKSYNKTYMKSVIGHTHSPQIYENTCVVGTNSKINLNYTSKLSNWAIANAIVHKNGTIQLIMF